MDSDLANDTLQAVLRSFERYYTLKREDAAPPFVAEAEFHSHTEQYFLVKAAKVADIDSNEFVFFAQEERLSAERLRALDDAAWKEGLGRVRPYNGHRNSDVTLIILADAVDGDVWRQVRRLRRYKSYKFSLWGWTSYRILAKELSTGRTETNRLGRSLRKLPGLK